MWRKPTKYNEGYKNPLETSVKLDTRDIRPVAFHEDIDRRGHYLSLYETTTSPLSPHLLPASPPSLYSQGHAMKSVRARTNAPTIWSFGRVLTLHYRQQTVLSLYLVHILIIVFYRAIRLTGPFVTMVYSMITGDMLTFGIIYMVVLFGFCQSFYFLYKGFPGVKSSLYSSYHSTWMALFQITLGDYNVSHHSSPINHRFIVAIFFFFCTRVFFLFSFFFLLSDACCLHDWKVQIIVYAIIDMEIWLCTGCLLNMQRKLIVLLRDKKLFMIYQSVILLISFVLNRILEFIIWMDITCTETELFFSLDYYLTIYISSNSFSLFYI